MRRRLVFFSGFAIGCVGEGDACDVGRSVETEFFGHAGIAAAADLEADHLDFVGGRKAAGIGDDHAVKAWYANSKAFFSLIACAIVSTVVISILLGRKVAPNISDVCFKYLLN